MMDYKELTELLPLPHHKMLEELCAPADFIMS
jgi:hypothetical protein